MGLCYGTDSWALTVARRMPAGRYSPPLGEAGRGIKWQVSPRLRGRGRKGSGRQPLRGAVESLATAFPLKCGSLAAGANGAEGVRESVTDLLRHSLPAKGGNEGCLSGRPRRPRRASTAFLIGPGKALPPERGTIGLNHFAIGQNFRIFAVAMEVKGR